MCLPNSTAQNSSGHLFVMPTFHQVIPFDVYTASELCESAFLAVDPAHYTKCCREGYMPSCCEERSTNVCARRGSSKRSGGDFGQYLKATQHRRSYNHGSKYDAVWVTSTEDETSETRTSVKAGWLSMLEDLCSGRGVGQWLTRAAFSRTALKPCSVDWHENRGPK